MSRIVSKWTIKLQRANHHRFNNQRLKRLTSSHLNHCFKLQSQETWLDESSHLQMTHPQGIEVDCYIVEPRHEKQINEMEYNNKLRLTWVIQATLDFVEITVSIQLSLLYNQHCRPPR